MEWTEGQTVYLSIPFTWLLPMAYSRCIWLQSEGYRVKAGGPAVTLMPQYLSGLAEYGSYSDAVARHNPDAMFTSRGCIRRCDFCAVWRTEGQFAELDQWPSRPIICDNNLLACSRRHFDKVIDSLKGLKSVDFNQGLDARLLKPEHAARIAELDISMVRLAWDDTRLELQFMHAVEILNQAGFSNRHIQAYVLFGFRDTPSDALYRCETLKSRGIRANPQRYQPLDSLAKNSYVSPGWTERELRRFGRYWARQNWLSKIPYAEYRG